MEEENKASENKGKKRMTDVFFSAKKKALTFQKKVLTIEIDLNGLKRSFYKYRIFSGYLILFLILVSVLIFSLKSKADIANFYPEDCLGSWENPKNAEGVPEVKDNSLKKEFSPENSAILNNTNGQLFCGKFTGQIPKDTLPKNFVLKFSIFASDSLLPGHEPFPLSETENSNPEENTSPLETNQTETQTPETAVPETTAPETATPENPLPAPVEGETVVPADATANPPEVVPEPASAPAPATSEPSGGAETTPVSFLPGKVFSVAYAEEGEGKRETLPLSEIPNEDSSSDYLEVAYTLDGTGWKSLGYINEKNIKDPIFSIPLENLSYDDISRIQISLNPVMSIDKAKIFYLDGLWIEVEYEKIGETEKALPKISVTDDSSVEAIDGASDFGSDEVPTFSVNDPDLSRYKLAQLVEEKKALVIEDKDKVLDNVLGVERNTEEKNVPSTGAGFLENIQNKIEEQISNIIAPTGEQAETSPAALPEESGPDSAEQVISNINSILPDVNNLPAPREEIVPSPKEEPKQAEAEASVEAPAETAPAETSSGTEPAQATENPATSFLFNTSLIARAEAFFSGTKISEAKVLDVNGNETAISTKIETVEVNGKETEQVKVIKPVREFRPGKYTLKVTLETDTAILETKQDFTWGVLVVNTDKSIYAPGDKAYLQMGVINEQGHTICAASMAMEITTPSGTVYDFSTESGAKTNLSKITRDSKCGPDNVILDGVPDYHADFLNTDEEGEYKIKLTATTENGTKTIYDKFKVASGALFSVRRVTASRIQPSATYPVSIYVTAKNDFYGKVVERVPASFEISPPKKSLSYLSIEEKEIDPLMGKGQEKLITWNLELKAGEEETLGYYYNAPDISPELFLLGPLEFYPTTIDESSSTEPIFKEIRKWQIASDATCSSSGTGNWSDGTKWSGCSGSGGKPGAGDNITVSAGHTITMDENSAALGSITIASTGILDTSASNYSLTGTIINIQGTLTANGSTITLNGTSGTIFTKSGTFTPGASTVVITSDASVTLTPTGGSYTFYNLSFTPTITGDRTYTFGSGSQTINGDFTINPSASSSYSLTSNVGGGITVAATKTTTVRASSSATATLSRSSTNLSTGFLDIESGGTVSATGATLTLTGTTGTLMTLGGTGSFSAGSSTVSITGAGSNTINSAGFTGSNKLYNLTINASGYTKTLGSNIELDSAGTLNVTLGTFDTNSTNNYSVTTGFIRMDSNSSSAIFNANGSTITLNGTSGMLFYKLGSDVFNSGTSTIVVTSDAGISVFSSSVTFTVYNLTLSPTITADRAYSTGTIGLTINGNFSINPTASSGSPRLTVTCSHNTTVAAAKTTTVQASGNALATLNEGSLTLSTGFLDIESGGTVSDSLSGTITLTGTTGTLITLGGTGAFSAGTSQTKVTSDADVTVSSGAISFYHLSFTPTITGNRTYTLGTGTTTIGGNFYINPTASSALSLTVNMAGDVNVTGLTTITKTTSATSKIDTRPVSTDYNLTTGLIRIDSGGTLDCTSSSSIITLTGSTSTLFYLVSGTFTAGTSTVIMNPDADATLTSGSPSFYNLTLSPTLTGNRVYSIGSAISISAGSFTINPDAASNYTLTVNAGGNISGPNFPILTLTRTNSALSILDMRPSTTDYTITTGKIVINSGGTLDLSGSSAATITLTGQSGVLFTLNSGGAFSPGNSSVNTASGIDVDIQVTSGAITFYQLALNPTITANRNWLLGDNDLNFTNLSITPSAASGVTLFANLGSNITVSSVLTLSRSSSALSVLDTRPGSVDYNISAGSITINTGATLDCTGSSSVITLTGTGTGTLFTKTGTFNQGTSEVKVTSASGSPRLLSAATTLHKLTIDSAASVVNAGAVITMSNADAGNKIYVKTGVLNDGGNTIVGTANGTFQVDAGAAFCVSGTALGTNATCDSSTTPTTASTFPTNYIAGNISLAATSTVYYNANAASAISAVPTYGNLYFKPRLTVGRTYTLGGALTINGDFTVNPQASSALALTVNAGGNITVTNTGTTTITRTTLATSKIDVRPSTTNYNLSTGYLNVATGGTLDCASAASTITLTGTGATALFTLAGTFTITSGTPTVIMNPDADVTLTSGAITFYNLTLSPTLTAAHIYTFGSGATVANNNFTINPTAASPYLLTVNMAVDMTVTGTTLISGTSNGASSLVTKPASTNYNLSTGKLQIDAGDTLDCTGSTSTITLTATSSALFTKNAAGTFNQGLSTVIMNPAATVTLTSGAITFYNLSLTPSIGSGYTYTFGAGAININGNFTINPTSASAVALTVNMGADITVSSAGTTTITRTTNATASLVTRPVSPSYNLSTGYLNIATGGTLNCTSATSNITLTATSGTLFTEAGTFTPGSSTVILSGNGDATFNADALTVYNLTSSGTGTKSLGAAITISNNFTISGGIFDDNNFQITGNGTGTLSMSASTELKLGTGTGTSFPTNFTNAHISLNTTSTVTYEASVNQTISALPVYGNLTTATGGTKTLGGNTTVANVMTIGGSTILDESSYTLYLSGTTGTPFVNSGTFTPSTGTVSYTGDYSGGNTNVLATTYNNLTFNNGSETYILAGDTVVGGVLTISAGALNASSRTITLSGTTGTPFVNSGTFTAGTSTVNYTGNYAGGNTSVVGTTYNNLILNNGSETYILAGDTVVGGVLTITAGALDGSSRTLTLSGTSGTPFVNNGTFTASTSTVAYTGNNTGGNTSITNVVYNNLTVNNASEIFVLVGDTTLNGNLYIQNGTLDVGDSLNYKLYVGGNWTNNGSYLARSNLVTLNSGTTATVSGATNFYDLTITHTTAKEVDFPTGSIIGVSHNFIVTGHDGALIKLYSTSSSTKWHFNPTGSATVSYADVRDGGCEATAITITPTDTADSGNNESCWNLTKTLTFSLSDNSIYFGVLRSSGNSCWAQGTDPGRVSCPTVTETEAHYFTAETNSASGYNITLTGATLTSDSTGNPTITAIGGTNTAPSIGTEQFGVRFTATGGSGTVSSPYDGSGYAFDLSQPSRVAYSSGASALTTYSARYMCNIDPQTDAGTYTTTLTYVITGNF